MSRSPRLLGARALAMLSAALVVARTRGRHGAAAFAAAALLWICAASPAYALNLTVDTFGDSAAAGFQACTAAAAGDCTLRGAIVKANSVAGPHTINGQGTFDFLHEHLSWPRPDEDSSAP